MKTSFSVVVLLAVASAAPLAWAFPASGPVLPAAHPAGATPVHPTPMPPKTTAVGAHAPEWSAPKAPVPTAEVHATLPPKLTLAKPVPVVERPGDNSEFAWTPPGAAGQVAIKLFTKEGGDLRVAGTLVDTGARLDGRPEVAIALPSGNVVKREIRQDDKGYVYYEAQTDDGALMVSSRPRSEADIEAHRAAGYRRIVSFEVNDGHHGVEQEAAWAHQVSRGHKEYVLEPVNIPVPDFHTPKESQVVQFLDVATADKTICHCHAGQGRTHMFKAFYRIAKDGWSVSDAKAEAALNGCNSEQLAFIDRVGAKLQDRSNPLHLSDELKARLNIAYAP